MSARASIVDYVAIVVCTLAWGTTWYAITLQFGLVDPVVSVAYRFALAALLLFAWCVARHEPITLTRVQHHAALGLGIFAVAIPYPLVYWAEQRIVSAVVAVIYAALAFFNLVAFRIAFGQHKGRAAWLAAGLGIVGVALLSWGEIASAEMSSRALVGLALALAAVACGAVSNVYARRGEDVGTPLAALMAWSMTYATLLLAVFIFATARPWKFEVSARYVGSLLYLAVIGTFVAFLLYYGVARRRGYTTASYILALTPLVAMAVSTVFENKTWSVTSAAGVVLVLTGKWLLVRREEA